MGLRVSDATAAVVNPRLAFRLDPGEPGVLRSASASQSTLRVAEQEGRNTRRLEAAALRAGRVVTRSVRTFTRGDTGSFQGTVAGQTRVESVEQRPTPVETAQNLAAALATNEPSPVEPAPTPEAVGSGSVGSIGLFNGGFRFVSAETAAQERSLVAQQTRIERELVQIAGVSIRLDNPEAAAEVRQQTAALRRSAQQIERDINRIRLAHIAASAQRLTRVLFAAAASQTEPAGAIIQAATGAAAGSANPTQDFLNLVA